jgi:hypothetical protein
MNDQSNFQYSEISCKKCCAQHLISQVPGNLVSDSNTRIKALETDATDRRQTKQKRWGIKIKIKIKYVNKYYAQIYVIAIIMPQNNACPLLQFVAIKCRIGFIAYLRLNRLYKLSFSY